jgi:hypothetical protein
MQLINDEVRIESTTLCNAACITCPRDKFKRKLMTMDNSHYSYLLYQVHELGAKIVSVFGYGEPLMDKDISWKIRHAADYGLKTFITTNASLLTVDKGKDLVASGLNHIRFSAHGIGEDYDKVHVGLKFSNVQFNIGHFLITNAVNNGNRCQTDVSIIPMHGETVIDLLSYWRNTRIDNIEIWKPHNWCDGREYRKTERKLKTCGRPESGPVQIQADGKMIVCCFDTNGELEVGDTHKDTIEDILKGDKFNEIRRKHEVGDLSGLICETCDQLNVEKESPLLYSSIDKEINKTSSTKFKLDVKEL